MKLSRLLRGKLAKQLEFAHDLGKNRRVWMNERESRKNFPCGADGGHSKSWAKI